MHASEHSITLQSTPDVLQVTVFGRVPLQRLAEFRFNVSRARKTSAGNLLKWNDGLRGAQRRSGPSLTTPAREPTVVVGDPTVCVAYWQIVVELVTGDFIEIPESSPSWLHAAEHLPDSHEGRPALRGLAPSQELALPSMWQRMLLTALPGADRLKHCGEARLARDMSG